MQKMNTNATRNDLSLIAVVMKAPSTKVRFAEAQKLLDYGFSNFEFKKIANQRDLIGQVQIDKGTADSVNAVLEADSGVLLSKRQDKDISQSIDLVDHITAPVQQGEVLGKITYTLDGKEIASVNIVAENTVKKNSTFHMIESVYLKWFSLLRK